MVICGELVRQMREYEIAKRDFESVQKATVNIVDSNEARIARAILGSAMKKREACHLALMAHEIDHGCAVFLLSA